MTKNKKTELEELEELLADKEAQIEEIDFINPYEEGGVIWEEWTKKKFLKALNQLKQRSREGALEDMMYSDESVIMRECVKLHKQHKKQKELKRAPTMN